MSGLPSDLFSGIASGVGSVINAISTDQTNRQNERLMRESWARDDNAVQRRAADLESAGLSSTLAAGSAAGTSPVTTLKAPDWGEGLQSGVQSYQSAHMNALQEKVQKKTLENKLRELDMQEKALQIKKDVADQGITYSKSLTKGVDIKNAIASALEQSDIASGLAVNDEKRGKAVVGYNNAKLLDLGNEIMGYNVPDAYFRPVEKKDKRFLTHYIVKQSNSDDPDNLFRLATRLAKRMNVKLDLEELQNAKTEQDIYATINKMSNDDTRIIIDALKLIAPLASFDMPK